MAGTREGRFKQAAKKLGMTYEDYIGKINSGQKCCTKCKNWRPATQFDKDVARWDKLAARCVPCSRVAVRKITKGRPSPRRGQKLKPEHVEMIRKRMKENPPRPMLGKKHTAESRRKMSLSRRGKYVGEKSPKWKGGLTSINQRIRGTAEYLEWRDFVFRRDKYTCQDCGDSRGGNLNAHHIKEFATYPELRFEVSNGITLCRPCHENRHFKPDSTRNLKKLKTP